MIRTALAGVWVLSIIYCLKSNNNFSIFVFIIITILFFLSIVIKEYLKNKLIP